MDLIGGYLLIILLLFAGNLALFLGNYKITNVKLAILSAASFVVSFVLIYLSTYLNSSLVFLLDYFSYIFLLVAILVFAVMWGYVKGKLQLKQSIYLISIIAIISAVLLSSQSNLVLFEPILYSLFVFIILFSVYQLTKLLIHAKRPYSVIISEFMCLFSILMFIFALTYNSARQLNYTMFSSFLILTPTYQLIYVVIGICVVLIVGFVLNDSKGGNS